MTLLPSATHIDITAAMALWILGWHILWGVPPKYDNESNKKNRLLLLQPAQTLRNSDNEANTH